MGTVRSFEAARTEMIAEMQKAERSTPVETIAESLFYVANIKGIPTEYVIDALDVVASISSIEGESI